MTANLDRLTHSYALESNTVLRIGEYGMERIFCQDLMINFDRGSFNLLSLHTST